MHFDLVSFMLGAIAGAAVVAALVVTALRRLTGV